MNDISPKNWGEYQRACHKMLTDLFDSKKEAYTWLHEKFGRDFQFHKLKHDTDLEKLKQVHKELWLLSFKVDPSLLADNQERV